MRLRIVNLRSTDPAALRLKVRAYLSKLPDDWRTALDDRVAHHLKEERGPWEDTTGASLLRDIVTACAGTAA